MLQADSRDM
jgi:hypothetical protein